MNTSLVDLIKSFVAKRPHFSKFLLVGSFNTLLDITLYLLFSGVFDFHVIAANILSTGITMCISYMLNRHFVFESKKRKRDTAITFFVVTLFNAWVVQSLVITGVVNSIGHLHYLDTHEWILNLVAKVCSVGVAFMLNFVGYRFIFTERKAQETNDSAS